MSGSSENRGEGLFAKVHHKQGPTKELRTLPENNGVKTMMHALSHQSTAVNFQSLVKQVFHFFDGTTILRVVYSQNMYRFTVSLPRFGKQPMGEGAHHRQTDRVFRRAATTTHSE
jgi:hypothetical protein